MDGFLTSITGGMDCLPSYVEVSDCSIRVLLDVRLLCFMLTSHYIEMYCTECSGLVFSLSNDGTKAVIS